MGTIEDVVSAINQKSAVTALSVRMRIMIDPETGIQIATDPVNGTGTGTILVVMDIIAVIIVNHDRGAMKRRLIVEMTSE